jgi:membrane-associated phospholipid phosphatase
MHAMAVFSLLPILTKYLSKQKPFWIVFGLFVVSSRVYLGFHYLSDAVFGMFAGHYIGVLALKLYEGKKSWR